MATDVGKGGMARELGYDERAGRRASDAVLGKPARTYA